MANEFRLSGGIITSDVELTSTGVSNTVTLITPGSLGASYTLTLPVDDGTSGQYLKTDGSGTLSWDTPAGGAGNAFTTIAVSGENDIVADSGTDTLTFVEAGGVNITTNDTTDTLTVDYDITSLSVLNGPGEGAPEVAIGDQMVIYDTSATQNTKLTVEDFQKLTYDRITGDVDISTAGVAAISANAIVNADINASAAIADTKLATISTAGKVANSATSGVSTSTADTLVLRDSNADFAANDVTLSKVTSASTITVESASNTNVVLSPQGTGVVDASSKRITAVADPTAAQDAATKAYVDMAVQGLDVKDSVRAATTADITLSGTQTVDTVSLAVNDRVLVKNQATASENGIYDVQSGAWSRSADADNTPGAEVTSGMFTFIEEGGQAGTGWTLTTADPITLDTTSLAFAQFSGGGGGAPVAGNGIDVSGNTVSLKASPSTVSWDTPTLTMSTTTASSSHTTGALVVSGGVGVALDINGQSGTSNLDGFTIDGGTY